LGDRCGRNPVEAQIRLFTALAALSSLAAVASRLAGLRGLFYVMLALLAASPFLASLLVAARCTSGRRES